MKKMPESIKNTIRKYAAAQIKAMRLHESLIASFEKYGVPYDNLVACANRSDYSVDGDEETEALAYINNCEVGDIEGSINDIERVFLHFVNNHNNGYE